MIAKAIVGMILMILAVLLMICMWQEAKCHFQLQLMDEEKAKNYGNKHL